MPHPHPPRSAPSEATGTLEADVPRALGVLRARPPDRAGGRALARCAVVIALCAAALLPGCEAQASPQSAAEQQVGELVEAWMPLPKDLTSDIQDRHFQRKTELLARARAGGREVGLAALARLREGAPQDEHGVPFQEIEITLLQTAAHAAPLDARPLLEVLVTQYGAGLHLRTEALLCLADTSPERALEILEPLVTKARPTQTMPPAEYILEGWLRACDKTGRSPVKELVDIATNLFYDQTARIKAIKRLGLQGGDPLATQALSAILIESTGDGYMRRMAAQALRDSLPREEACQILLRVADREADLNMLKFLKDLLEKHCGF